jgi:hypothetical protein
LGCGSRVRTGKARHSRACRSCRFYGAGSTRPASSGAGTGTTACTKPGTREGPARVAFPRAVRPATRDAAGRTGRPTSSGTGASGPAGGGIPTTACCFWCHRISGDVPPRVAGNHGCPENGEEVPLDDGRTAHLACGFRWPNADSGLLELRCHECVQQQAGERRNPQTMHLQGARRRLCNRRYGRRLCPGSG